MSSHEKRYRSEEIAPLGAEVFDRPRQTMNQLSVFDYLIIISLLWQKVTSFGIFLQILLTTVTFVYFRLKMHQSLALSNTRMGR